MIRAWKSVYDNPHRRPGEPKDVSFAVGQPEAPAGSMYESQYQRERYIGTDISVSGPSYQPTFHQHPDDIWTGPGPYTRSGSRRELNPTKLFDYEPGIVHGMYSDARAPHTAGVAMGLAAQWHRQQGAERNVAHGMPTYDISLSSDSAPIAQRLLTRGMIPPNPQGSPEVTNDLGRDSEFGVHTQRIYPGEHEVSPAEMRGGREVLREVMGKKRTAPIQTHTPPDHGEQQRLF
jgi:hypothetical protein